MCPRFCLICPRFCLRFWLAVFASYVPVFASSSPRPLGSPNPISGLQSCDNDVKISGLPRLYDCSVVIFHDISVVYFMLDLGGGCERHTAILMLLALAAIVWFSLAAVEARRLRPPTTRRTLPSFLSVMPRALSGSRYAMSVIRQYLLVVGRLPATVTLPSGPPEYVFDSSGNLLDWTADSGDDPRFVEALRGHRHPAGRHISEAEAVDSRHAPAIASHSRSRPAVALYMAAGRRNDPGRRYICPYHRPVIRRLIPLASLPLGHAMLRPVVRLTRRCSRPAARAADLWSLDPIPLK